MRSSCRSATSDWNGNLGDVKARTERIPGTIAARGTPTHAWAPWPPVEASNIVIRWLLKEDMMGRARTVTSWTLSGLLAALYLFAGATKLAGMQMHVVAFAHWGYPSWFMYVVGAWEVTGAILLVIPRASAFAAALLALNMAGAVYTTAIRVHEPNTAIVPGVLFMLLVIGGYLRQPMA
jgi:putative oxidoreductase